MIDSGSLVSENNKRLEVLYRKHHRWLEGVAFKITRNHEDKDDLIGELYVYLSERPNDNLWYNDSFNLMYCRSFIHSRYFNKLKREKKQQLVDEFWEIEDIEYDYDGDILLQEKYDEVVNELKSLQKTSMWASAQLFHIYMFSDLTMDGVSEAIGVSKSTTFSHIKKVRQFLKSKIQNPFK